MKKLLALSVLLGLSLVFTGCEKQQLTNEQFCNNNGGKLETRYEGGEESTVCSFDDQSFCYIEDLVSKACNPGELFYEDEGNPEENNPEENQEIDETPVEQLYVTDTHDEMSFEEKESTFISCDELGEDPVCGADGGTYYNRCYLEFAGIPEDTQARIVDGICIYE